MWVLVGKGTGSYGYGINYRYITIIYIILIIFIKNIFALKHKCVYLRSRVVYMVVVVANKTTSNTCSFWRVEEVELVVKKQPPTKTSIRGSFSRVEVEVLAQSIHHRKRAYATHFRRWRQWCVDKKSPPSKTSSVCSFSMLEAVVVLAKSPPSKMSHVQARFLKVVVVLGWQNTPITCAW
jgi:hypothetical protein